MSVSIAHPERYDRYLWTGLPTIESVEGEVPDEWECLGVDENEQHFWGHLKPQYQGGDPLLDMVASITDSLRILREHREANWS